MESLEQIRIQKLKQIQELGYDPYPTFYRHTHTLARRSQSNSPRNPPKSWNTANTRCVSPAAF